MEYSIIIKTFAGLEVVLADEVMKLGGKDVKPGTRMVQCKGDLGFVYKANFSLRAALKVLVKLDSFTFSSQDSFYNKLLKFNWDDWMTPKSTFKVDAVVSSDIFTNDLYTKLLAKDAIVDFFKNKNNERPNVEKETPDFYFNIHIKDNYATILIDSSGESLHKRSYKDNQHLATINEVLASGLLLLANWDGKGNFLDPMCGGGTMLIEAAMIAANIPPQVNRSYFAFKDWPNFDEEFWGKIKETRLGRIKDFNGEIIGYDKDEIALEKSKENIEAAQLSDFIRLENIDFFDSKKSASPLLIVCNPPYNERLMQADLDFYNKIGDTLKQNYPNTMSWWISSDARFWKNIGLRSDRKINLYNGKLECKYVRYDTYEGSKKRSKKTEAS